MEASVIDIEPTAARLASTLAELQQAREALQKTEAHLAETQRLAELGSWEWDVASNVVTWSDELCRIYGLLPGEFAGTYEAFLERVHPDDRELAHQTVERAYRDHQPFAFFHRIVRPDGKVRVLHGRGNVQVGDSDQPVRMWGTSQDVTERRQSEAMLQRQVRELTALHAVAVAGADASNEDALIERANQIVGHLLYPDNFGVLLLDSASGVLRVHRSYHNWTLAPRTLLLGQGITGQVAADGRARRVGDVSLSRDYIQVGTDIRSELCVPLKAGDRILGVINAERDRANAFDEEDERLLTTFASQLATSIEKSRLFEQVRAGRERLQALSRRLVEVQEAERRHIARELHDEVGQLLTGLKLVLDMAARQPIEHAADAFGEAQGLVSELLGRVRELSLRLRPAMLDDLGLVPALTWHMERYSAQTQVKVAFEHTGLDGHVDADVETAAYRIIQEALTNVARHAKVDMVTVRLWASPEALGVQIEDHGVGFSPTGVLTSGQSSGLEGIRERVALLGGRLSIDATPGAGTCLTAVLPLKGHIERRQGKR